MADPLTWEQAKPHIEAALKYAGGTHTPDDILKGIISGQFQFWGGRRSVIITQIIKFPQMNVCRIFLAGGDKHELVEEMEPDVCKWAVDAGCKRIEVAGRSGWERVLKDYDRLAVCLVKELNNEQK